MIIENLDAKARKCAGLQTDSRWTKWAKWVDQIDPKGDSGFAFNGDFIRSGTIEVDPATLPRLILCCAETGSAKYRTKTYAVVILRPDGTLEATDLTTDDSTKGWALRLRDPMIALLESLKLPADPVPDPDVDVTIIIKASTYAVMNMIKERVNETSDDELITVALDALIESQLVQLRSQVKDATNA